MTERIIADNQTLSNAYTQLAERVDGLEEKINLIIKALNHGQESPGSAG